MADREQFEAWLSAPPAEAQYRHYLHASLWICWQAASTAARRQGREEMKRRALCAAQGVCMDVMAHPDVQAIMRGDMASAVKAACEAASMGVADRIEAKIRALPLDEEDGRD